MKYETAILAAILSLASATPVPSPRNVFVPPTPPTRMLRGREVPQEHSHEEFLTSVRTTLNLDNPDKIKDPVFGLLGNAAATDGLGSISDPDCLHQATADQAFTNAKAAGDVAGMTSALIYATLERNTGKVGLASVLCTAIKATNPEIAALSQHQDPASAGAAATNKAITLELAKQIASIGGDPQEALKSGTFAAGDPTDPTAKGKSCNDLNDKIGCIFSQNLLVEDATPAEITAAAAGGSTGGVSPGNSTAIIKPGKGRNSTAKATPATPVAVNNACSALPTVTVTPGASTKSSASTGNGISAANHGSATENATTGGDAGATGTNIQTFTGALGGITAPEVLESTGDRPFSVNGNTFVLKNGALQRSCDIQKNKCLDAANSGALAGGIDQCATQLAACSAAKTA